MINSILWASMVKVYEFQGNFQSRKHIGITDMFK